MKNSPIDWYWKNLKLVDRELKECTDTDILETTLKQVTEIKNDYRTRAAKIFQHRA